MVYGIVLTTLLSFPNVFEAIPEGQDETRMATEEARTKVREELSTGGNKTDGDGLPSGYYSDLVGFYSDLMGY